MTRAPAYRISLAARLSGLSEEVIRAWERRYGVVRPRRTSGGYRVYSEADVAVLRRLREFTVSGIAIAEAARLVRTGHDLLPRLTTGAGAVADGQLGRWRDEILAAAERLDQAAVDHVLDEALALLPVLRIYQDVLVPVAHEAGERWHEGRFSVAEEHLVSATIRARLLAALHATRGQAGRHVICACFPEEQHEIGLLGAALRFRQAGYRVTYLGQRTPAEHLGRVAHRLRPDAVALSCTTDPGAQAFREVLAAVAHALSPRTRLLVGGAAAARHAGACDEAGALLLADETAWDAALR